MGWADSAIYQDGPCIAGLRMLLIGLCREQRTITTYRTLSLCRLLDQIVLRAVGNWLILKSIDWVACCECRLVCAVIVVCADVVRHARSSTRIGSTSISEAEHK
jgi:hypothetical protein